MKTTKWILHQPALPDQSSLLGFGVTESSAKDTPQPPSPTPPPKEHTYDVPLDSSFPHLRPLPMFPSLQPLPDTPSASIDSVFKPLQSQPSSITNPTSASFLYHSYFDHSVSTPSIPSTVCTLLPDISVSGGESIDTNEHKLDSQLENANSYEDNQREDNSDETTETTKTPL